MGIVHIVRSVLASWQTFRCGPVVKNSERVMELKNKEIKCQDEQAWPLLHSIETYKNNVFHPFKLALELPFNSLIYFVIYNNNIFHIIALYLIDKAIRQCILLSCTATLHHSPHLSYITKLYLPVSIKSGSLGVFPLYDLAPAILGLPVIGAEGRWQGFSLS